MIILNAVLMTLIVTAIVSLLAWSIRSQNRDAGLQRQRRRRRVRVSVRLATLDEPSMFPDANAAR